MIRIDLHGELMNGHEATFQAPCDCSQITSLIAYYPSNGAIENKTFTFRDAHGNDLGNLSDLFVKDAFIKVILDKVNGYAYIQNADTNGYLEAKIPKAASDIGAVPTSRTVNGRALTGNITLSASDVSAVPVTRTVNGKALSGNITLSASDVNAYGTHNITCGTTTVTSALTTNYIYQQYE